MKKAIQAKLHKALLANGDMSYALYEYELEEHLDYWKAGMLRDKDEFLFVVTEHSGDVAMLLMTNKGPLFINEQAREQLQSLWKKGAYEFNIRVLLPSMAAQLAGGDLWVNGVKTMR
jgi:hypothetical protein